MKYHFAGNKHILLPMIEMGGYKTIGWNWFNIEEGEWNSCRCWETQEEALKVYKRYGIREVTMGVRIDEIVVTMPEQLFEI